MDLDPDGRDFIKLGLNDVLYNPKTKEVYTPNTNQTASVEGKKDGEVLQNDTENGIIQERKYLQDPKTGKMKGSTPKNAHSIKMGKAEARKISSEISTNYSRYEGKKNCVHYSLWKNKYYKYHFINDGFGDYKFKKKARV